MTTNSPQSKDDRPFMTEIFDRFMRLMPRNDFTLIVLKGQLLVEEQMDKFIEASLGEASEAFWTLKLSFGRKLDFARRLHRHKEPFAPVWNDVRELNELRNKIAHNPEIPDLDRRCTEFVEKRGPQPPNDVAPDAPSRLVFTIGNIVATIAGLRLGRELAMSNLGELDNDIRRIKTKLDQM